MILQNLTKKQLIQILSDKEKEIECLKSKLVAKEFEIKYVVDNIKIVRENVKVQKKIFNEVIGIIKNN